MNARMRRILSDYEQIKKNFSNHKNIVVEPIGGDPPEKYRVTYYVNGIYLMEDGRIETLGKHIVLITLHSDYPRYKPICTIATPIWHPNFRDGQICIGDIWGAGESLSDIIVNIGDMIQYKSWNSYSPLSAEAADWAIENKHLFPVGNINLWTGEEEDGSAVKDFDIDLFGEDGEAQTGPETAAADTEAVPEEGAPSEGAEEAKEDAPEMNDTGDKPAEAAEDIPAAAFTQAKKGGDDDIDFEITADELAGIEFVPTAARMQGSQYGATAKGGKINFKTVFMKGILWGLIGGFIAWLLQEFIPVNQENILGFSGYTIEGLTRSVLYGSMSSDKALGIIANATRISSAFFSAFIGGGIGMLMGVGEGVYYGSKDNAIKYGAIGLGIALVIGFVGGYLSQMLYSTLLSDTNEYTSDMYYALVRSISWALMGAGIGLAIGLIKPEKMRIINCTIGGIAGGFIGGFIFNFIAGAVSTGANDTGMIPRLIGIIIMGALVGLGIGLLEQFAKSAWLKVIRGEFEGKEYLVFEGRTTIGNSGKNTIVLFKDKLVAPAHCEIVQEGSKYVLVDKGSPIGTIVNGMRISRHVLRQGDAIAIGNSVLVFNTK